MCASTLFMCFVAIAVSCKMKLDMLERVDQVMRQTGIGGIIRAEQPSNHSRIEESHPDERIHLINVPRTETKTSNRKFVLSNDNIEAITRAVNQRQLQSNQVKPKVSPSH